VNIVSSGARRRASVRSIVARRSELDLFVLIGKTQTNAVTVAIACGFAGDAGSEVNASGHSIARHTRCCKTALAAILVEAVSFATLCALLLANLFTSILLFLGLLLFLKLAASFTNILLACSSVYLAARANTETTHVERAAERGHSI
jgi:uncharacterized protein YacL